MTKKSAFEIKEDAILFRDNGLRQGEIFSALSFALDCDTFFGVYQDETGELRPFSVTRDLIHTKRTEWYVGKIIEAMSKGYDVDGFALQLARDFSPR